MRRTRTTAAVLAGVLGLAGCGAADAGDAPVELTMWAWAPGITEVVDLFNASHPDIHVKVDTQAQGDNLVTKLLTADWAGATPDVAQAEYQALPSLVVSGVVRDITDDVAPVRDAYSDGVWDQVTFDDRIYAVPQDIGPMMMFYRADLMAEMGLEVPTTWEDFADVAAQVRAQDDGRWLTTFSAADPGWFTGLSQQAGARWWDVDASGWDVTVDDEPTQRVADYWGGLVEGDLVQDQPMYTPDWNSWLNDGTLLAWPGAVWSPAVLEGIAPDTAGDWVMAALPQWDADAEPTTGLWGGSTTAVMAETDHPEEAAELARWLNTDPVAVDALISVSNVYPATTLAQDAPALDEAPSFMPNQPDFFARVAEIAEGVQPFTWGPVVNETYATYGDAFSAAVLGRSTFTGAVETMQETTESSMRAQGFSLQSR